MKILYFCQLFNPVIHGGGEYIFYQWAKEMAKKGHKVFVITQRLKKTPDTEIIDNITVFRVGTRLSQTSQMGLYSNLSYLISAFFKGLDTIRHYKIDLIHSNTYVPVFAAQMCSKITHIPHIVTVHDVYHTEKNFWQEWSSQENTPNSWLSGFAEKQVLKTNCTAFHTISEKSKQDMESAGVSKKIHVIPNGIDPTPYHTATEKNQAVFVGRLVFYKNVETILEAFNKVIQKIPDARLVIIGDGPLKNQLQKKAEFLGVSQNTEFTGTIPDEQKIKVLSESKILLNPSLVEGFGIVILEAFASKKPVIVSNTRPLSDLVANSKDGYVVDAKSPQDWSKKIIELLSDTKKAQEMGKAGHDKVLSNYTISKVAEKLENLYQSVLN